MGAWLPLCLQVTCHSPNGGCPLKVKSNTCYCCDLYEPGVRGRRAGARARGLGRRVSAVPWEGAGRRSGALGCLRASCPTPPQGWRGLFQGLVQSLEVNLSPVGTAPRSLGPLEFWAHVGPAGQCVLLCSEARGIPW